MDNIDTYRYEYTRSYMTNEGMKSYKQCVTKPRVMGLRIVLRPHEKEAIKLGVRELLTIRPDVCLDEAFNLLSPAYPLMKRWFLKKTLSEMKKIISISTS